MTTIVDAAPNVVNDLAIDCNNVRCWSGYAAVVSTLLERLEHLLALRAVSARELARRSNLAEQHVSTIITRLRKNPQTNVGLPTLQAIARGGGVSLNWLLTGAGTPESADRDEPSTSTAALGHVPIASNAQGWTDVLLLDQLAAANSDAGKLITPDAWERANHAARFLIHGPAAPGDALRIARLAMEVSDPARFNTAYAANLRELAAGRTQYEADAKAFHEAVAAKARGEKPASQAAERREVAPGEGPNGGARRFSARGV